MRRDTWNTYRTTAYTHDAANDRKSQGGVHHHQIKRGRSGWMERIYQTNGTHSACSAVWPMSDADGEAAFESAKAEGGAE